MTKIRDWLNEQGMRNTRGQRMTYNSVQHLLKNRRYMGEYAYRDIVVPDGIPAIVPKDLFERVQEKLVKNKKGPGPPQSRGRLSADDKAVLRLLRGLPLRREWYQPYRKCPPLLQMRVRQEEAA